MIRFVLDTDTFSHHLRQHPAVSAAIAAHLPEEMCLSIITVEEVWDGWQAAIRKANTPQRAADTYERLTEVLQELRNRNVVSYSLAAMQRYQHLKKQKLNIGPNDLKIAATALELNATVVTRNRRDFSRVPGLSIEDWTIPSP